MENYNELRKKEEMFADGIVEISKHINDWKTKLYLAKCEYKDICASMDDIEGMIRSCEDKNDRGRYCSQLSNLKRKENLYAAAIVKLLRSINEWEARLYLTKQRYARICDSLSMQEHAQDSEFFGDDEVAGIK